MERSKDSIGERIDRLARETDAPESFVERIRALFARKGISLDEDCRPYRTALEHAFSREQSIRVHTTQTRDNLVRLQTQLTQINGVLQSQLKRLESLRNSQRVPVRGAAARPGSRRGVSIRELVDRRASSSNPALRGYLVPGPKDIQ